MTTNLKESSLKELYDIIDQQIAANKARRPPGDRRRTKPWEAQPPQGIEERRSGMERRGSKRGMR